MAAIEILNFINQKCDFNRQNNQYLSVSDILVRKIILVLVTLFICTPNLMQTNYLYGRPSFGRKSKSKMKAETLSTVKRAQITAKVQQAT